MPSRHAVHYDAIYCDHGAIWFVNMILFVSEQKVQFAHTPSRGAVEAEL